MCTEEENPNKCIVAKLGSATDMSSMVVRPIMSKSTNNSVFADCELCQRNITREFSNLPPCKYHAMKLQKMNPKMFDVDVLPYKFVVISASTSPAFKCT
jgi:hypothetical protein